MTLDKKETGKKIINHLQDKGMRIDVDGFWKQVKTADEFRKKCKLFKIEPVYFKK